MYIDKEFAKWTNTQWDAIRECFFKKNVGKKLWFLHQYCILTGREPELLKMIEEIKENNIEFSSYSRKVKLGTTGFCYGWEATYFVKDINITDEQYDEIKQWAKRIRARKDSVVVDESANTNNKTV